MGGCCSNNAAQVAKTVREGAAHADFSGIRLNRGALEELERTIEGLETQNHLRALLLSWTRLGDDGIALLKDSIISSPSLEYLILVGNGLTDAGAASVADIIEHSSTLRVCSLSENAITRTGLAQLAAAVAHSNTLEDLRLGGNHIAIQSASDGLALLGPLVQLGAEDRDHFWHIDLRGNRVSKGVLRAMTSALQRRGAGCGGVMDAADVDQDADEEYLDVLEPMGAPTPTGSPHRAPEPTHHDNPAPHTRSPQTTGMRETLQEPQQHAPVAADVLAAAPVVDDSADIMSDGGGGDDCGSPVSSSAGTGIRRPLPAGGGAGRSPSRNPEDEGRGEVGAHGASMVEVSSVNIASTTSLRRRISDSVVAAGSGGFDRTYSTHSQSRMLEESDGGLVYSFQGSGDMCAATTVGSPDVLVSCGVDAAKGVYPLPDRGTARSRSPLARTMSQSCGDFAAADASLGTIRLSPSVHPHHHQHLPPAAAAHEGGAAAHHLDLTSPDAATCLDLTKRHPHTALPPTAPDGPAARHPDATRRRSRDLPGLPAGEDGSHHPAAAPPPCDADAVIVTDVSPVSASASPAAHVDPAAVMAWPPARRPSQRLSVGDGLRGPRERASIDSGARRPGRSHRYTRSLSSEPVQDEGVPLDTDDAVEDDTMSAASPPQDSAPASPTGPLPPCDLRESPSEPLADHIPDHSTSSRGEPYSDLGR